MVVTCSCPSCQHQTSVTAAAGWVPTVLPSPVCSSVTIPSRLRTGASLLPGSGPPLVLPSLLVLVLVAAFPYISSLFVARRRAPARPGPPRPPHPPRPAPQRHRCGPVRVDSTQQRGRSGAAAQWAQWEWDWKLRSFLALDCRLGF